MKKLCRFCGGETTSDTIVCNHCGKTLRRHSETNRETSGLTDLKAWEGKRVPAWLTYFLVGLALFCVYIMFAQGYERNNQSDEVEPARTDKVEPKNESGIPQDEN